MLLDILVDSVSLNQPPDERRFTFHPEGNAVGFDTAKSMLGARLGVSGACTLTVFDVLMLRKALVKLNLWGEVRFTDAAYKVLEQHLFNMSKLSQIKSGEFNNLWSNELKTTPYADQISGALFHLAMPRSGEFSSMGIGKSLIALMWMHRLKKDGAAKRVLVICKNGGKNVWRNEIAKHTGYSALIAGNGTECIEQDLANYFSTNPDVFVLHYNCLSSRRPKGQEGAKPIPSAIVELLKTSNFDTVILDEAHKIKHTTASWTQGLFDIIYSINPKNILVMTGTPVAESPENAYTLLKLIKPSIVPSKTAFLNRFTIRRLVRRGRFKVMDIVGYQNLDDLRDLISWVSFRRTQEDVVGMPPTVFVDVPCEMSSEQAKLYNAIASKVYEEIAAIPANALNLEVVAVKLIRLRQCLTHPYILGEKSPSCKFEECDDILEEVLADNDAKILLWSDFQPVVELLHHRYNEQYGSDFIHGGVPVEYRNMIERRFNGDARPRVLCLSPGAAGDSLNLQRARTAVYVSRPVSLTDYQQSLNRICRRTAKGTSVIKTIIVPNTVDDWLTALLTKKENISQALTIGADKLERIDKQFLLNFLKQKVMVKC